MTTTEIISKEDLLKHWLGHRNLTRKVIAAFPEKEFFDFSIGGMRTFAQLTSELLAIGAPGLKSIVNRDSRDFDDSNGYKTKAEFLSKWDESTAEIVEYWDKLDSDEFHANFNLFNQYEFPVIQNILYFIDNEIHHRGQGYVYLRAIGIEPPMFWDRS